MIGGELKAESFVFARLWIYDQTPVAPLGLMFVEGGNDDKRGNRGFDDPRSYEERIVVAGYTRVAPLGLFKEF